MNNLSAAVAELFQAKYLLLRPYLRDGGDTSRVIRAEDALARAFLGKEAEGIPDHLLFAAAARKAGQPLIGKDADALDLATGSLKPSTGAKRLRRSIQTPSALPKPHGRRKSTETPIDSSPRRRKRELF